jgi:hypothetical protein
MTETIAFISPKIDETMRQKIAESLRIRHIKTTDNIQDATLIIADVGQPVERMGIAGFAEKIVEQYLQKVSILNHEFLLLDQKPKKTKSEFNMRHPLKQFNQTKQKYRQRFFNRTRCK